MANSLLRLSFGKSNIQIDCSQVGGPKADIAQWLEENSGKSVEHLRAALGARGAIETTLYLKKVDQEQLEREDPYVDLGFHLGSSANIVKKYVLYSGIALPTPAKIIKTKGLKSESPFRFSQLPERGTLPAQPAMGAEVGV